MPRFYAGHLIVRFLSLRSPAFAGDDELKGVMGARVLCFGESL